MFKTVAELTHDDIFIRQEMVSVETEVQFILDGIQAKMEVPTARQFRTYETTYSQDFNKLLKYIKENNKSNDLPYHGYYHTCCMMRNVVRLYCKETGDSAEFEEYPRPENMVLTHDFICLIYAAAFHDFNHSGGKEPDYINIAEAQKAFQKYAYDHNLNGNIIRDVLALINVTQYPFVIHPVDTPEEVMRDADLLQLYEPLWFETNFVGLKKEVEVSKNRTFTHEEFCLGNLEFLAGCRMYTATGQNAFRATLLDVIKMLLKDEHGPVVDIVVKLIESSDNSQKKIKEGNLS
jgi:hypothetical protein